MQKQGNIAIIVLYILTVSALLVLTSLWSLTSLIKQIGTYTSFMEAYYMARWWSELGLVLSQKTAYWFFGTLDAWNSWLIVPYDWTWAINSHLVISKKDVWRLSATDFGADTCTSTNAFTLQYGENIVVPLFLDMRPLTWLDAEPEFVSVFQTNPRLAIEFIRQPTHTQGYSLLFGIAPVDEALFDRMPPIQRVDGVWWAIDARTVINEKVFDFDTSVFAFRDPADTSPQVAQPLHEVLREKWWYLLIGNPLCASWEQCAHPDPVKFCLVMSDPRSDEDRDIASVSTFIQSDARVRDVSVTMFARERLVIPDWFFQTAAE